MDDRYQRQIILPEIGRSGQERISRARVLVIGAGGLGCPALQYLTAAGTGTIGIVDDDVVSLSNLQRQVLYPTDSVGCQKVLVAKDVLARLNPDVQIETYSSRLSVANAGQLFSEFDLVLDGSDNFGTRYLVNDACVSNDKPFVAGSILQHAGYLSVFNWRDSDGVRGPTLRCLFPEPPDPVDAPNCALAGVLGSVAGIIGCCMAEEALKIIACFGEPLSGRLLRIDCATMRVESVQFTRLPDAGNHTVKNPSEYNRMNQCLPEGEGEIDYFDLLELLRRGRGTLIDVREAAERASGHIGGHHIPLAQVTKKLSGESHPLPLILYCASGARSQQARQQLLASGVFPESLVYSLSGGLRNMPAEISNELVTAANSIR